MFGNSQHPLNRNSKPVEVMSLVEEVTNVPKSRRDISPVVKWLLGLIITFTVLLLIFDPMFKALNDNSVKVPVPEILNNTGSL